MSSTPEWLPTIIEFTGDWEVFIQNIYDVFKKDFKDSRPAFDSVPVLFNKWIDPNDKYGYEEGFWHITSKDEWDFDPRTKKKIKKRVPDFRRAERVPWCRPVIENNSDSAILFWDYLEGNGRTNTYIWLKEHDYLVILEKRTMSNGVFYFIVSSFYIYYKAKRLDLTDKYNRRIGLK